jgi:NTP pyrophosphatase (non-canonical NTP hydrolase)
MRQLIFKVLAFVLMTNPWLVRRLFARAQRTPYFHLTGRGSSEPYMRRWWLFNPYDDANKRKYPWLPMSVRFHEILREDNDPHMHDHPWNAQTIILRGWYIEELEDKRPEAAGLDDARVVHMRQAGYTGAIRFAQYHRIVQVSGRNAGDTVLTLFFTFGKQDSWAFKVRGKRVHWKEYLQSREKHRAGSLPLSFNPITLKEPKMSDSTSTPPFSEMVRALAKPGEAILKSLTADKCAAWHMASCLPSEAGELFDAVKREVIYCKPLDRVNVIEEMGDIEFYLEGLRQVYGITREETIAANQAKLAVRYGTTYSDRAAQERADKAVN